MNRIDMARLFQVSQVAFRLESLDRYEEPPGEKEALRAVAEGRRLPPPSPDGQEWYDLVAAATASGRRFHRVHVIDDYRAMRQPLPLYLRFEMERYRGSIAEGEDVRIAVRGMHPDLDQLPRGRDFWLFDDQTAVGMRYDQDGVFLGTCHEDLGWCRRARDIATGHAVTLDEYERVYRPNSQHREHVIVE